MTTNVQECGVVEPLEEAPFEVVGDNIVVEFVEQDDVTESGIVLAGVEKRTPSTAIVVGVGPDARTACPEGERSVRVGDALVLHRHKKIKLEMDEDGRELFVFKPDAVIGILL